MQCDPRPKRLTGELFRSWFQTETHTGFVSVTLDVWPATSVTRSRFFLVFVAKQIWSHCGHKCHKWSQIQMCTVQTCVCFCFRRKLFRQWITIQLFLLNLHESLRRPAHELEVAEIRVDNQAFGKLSHLFGSFCIDTHTLFRCVRDYNLFVCRIEDTNPHMLRKAWSTPGRSPHQNW